jgi:hypothetical protein
LSQPEKPYHLTVDPEAGKIFAWEGKRFVQAFETAAHYQNRGAMVTMVKRLLEAGRFAWAGFNDQNTEVLTFHERPPSDATHR